MAQHTRVYEVELAFDECEVRYGPWGIGECASFKEDGWCTALGGYCTKVRVVSYEKVPRVGDMVRLKRHIVVPVYGAGTLDVTRENVGIVTAKQPVNKLKVNFPGQFNFSVDISEVEVVGDE